MAKANKIIIVGVGHIGASVGLALMDKKEQSHYVIGIEENGDYRATALKNKCVHEIHPVADFQEHCHDAEIVVVAAPLNVLPNVVLSCSEALVQSQRTKKRPIPPVITDVGSVKTPLLTEFGGGVSPLAPFVGGHPFAGNEKFGPEAADKDLFKNRMVILTPVKKTDLKALERVKLFWQGLGCEVEEMSPQEHDQVAGAVSHLPHLIAYCMMETMSRLSKPTPKRKGFNLLRYAGGGLKDFTRIASSNPLMWRDISMENQALILEATTEFRKVFLGMEDAVARGDGPRLEELFRHAQDMRKGL